MSGIFWAQVYNNLGGALHALGRYKEALPEFDKAIRQLPGMVMAYVNKGESQRILGICICVCMYHTYNYKYVLRPNSPTNSIYNVLTL